MTRSTAQHVDVRAEPEPVLRHILVAGGDLADWVALGEARWQERLAEFGKLADRVGASWLTLRPCAENTHEGHAVPHPAPERRLPVGSCVVAASSIADGRQRLVDAVEALRVAGTPITERAIAGCMNDPAEADPDLVVVLGTGHRLPPSLVWELAYSELVFIDVEWADLTSTHLEQAIDAFTHRHRRFGGLD